ncbi:MAG TPA: sulfite exporter TauE/SafE family protein [candidate division Zixibacteria bacterium]|nr:sulfite exporter TauE/SafE family protein [candidate division Zixibacteria bacterium]
MSVELALALIAAGLVAGFTAGLFGIGGGIVLVPAVVLLLGFDQHSAQGTSLAVMIPAALFGSWRHYRRGRLEPRHAALVAAGGILGSAAGGLLALSLDEAVLRRIFAVLVVVVAVRLLMPDGPRRIVRFFAGSG